MYHVALDLSPEQVRRLKVLAATTSTTVKELVSTLVVIALDMDGDPEAEKTEKEENTSV